MPWIETKIPTSAGVEGLKRIFGNDCLPGTGALNWKIKTFLQGGGGERVFGVLLQSFDVVVDVNGWFTFRNTGSTHSSA